MNKSIIIKAKKIKLIATDIDGVWTDSSLLYNHQGEVIKIFSTYDGMAVEMLKKYNFIVAILTSENSKIVIQRAKKLNINEVYINEKKKLLRLMFLAKKYKITMDNIAFIGDDINDIESLRAVGLSAMPPNSPILDTITPDFITHHQGGKGAFRDLANIILKAQKISPKY